MGLNYIKYFKFSTYIFIYNYPILMVKIMKSLAIALFVLIVIIGAAYYYKHGEVTGIVENVKNKLSTTSKTSTSTAPSTGTVTSTNPRTSNTQTTPNGGGASGGETHTWSEGSLESIEDKVVRDAQRIKFSYTASVQGNNKLSLSLSWLYDGPVFYLNAWNDRDFDLGGQHIGFYDRDLNALYEVNLQDIVELDVLGGGNLSSGIYSVYVLPDNVHPVDFRLIVSGFNYGLVVLNESGDILLYPVDFALYKVGVQKDFVSRIVFLKYEPFMEFGYPAKNFTLAYNAAHMDIQEACGIDDFRMEYFRLFYWNDTMFVMKSFSYRSISDIVEEGRNASLEAEEKTYNLKATGLKVADVYASPISSACSIIETMDRKLFITVPLTREAPLTLNNTLAIGPIFEDYKSIAIKYQGLTMDEPFGILALLDNNTIEFQRAFEYDASNQTLSYYSGTVKLDKPPSNEPVMIKFNSGPYPYSDALLAVIDNKHNIYIYNITIEKEDEATDTYGLYGKLIFKIYIPDQPTRLGFDYRVNEGQSSLTVLKNIQGETVNVNIPEGTIHFIIAYNQLTSNGVQIVYNITYGIQLGS